MGRMWSNEGEWLSGDDSFEVQPKKSKKKKKKAQPLKAHPAVSASQQDVVPEGMERNDNGFGFRPEGPSEEDGKLCNRGCGFLIKPYSYAALTNHLREAHPNE